MCGIVAVTGYKKALPLLINGLEKLEYRGYDSAGIAIINSETNYISCNKAEGKLKNLISNLNDHDIPGTVGIGHTRWATHGKPEVKNAHPHTDSSGNIAVVQNGIIENFQDLKNKLEDKRTEECLMLLDKFPALEKNFYDKFNKINFFPKELNLYELNANSHSEVISLLGEDLKNDIPIFIKCLSEIMDNKPNNSCYIASQQLGGKTKKLNHGASFFVHRKSTWKPWIYASWKKNDLQEKEVALEWIYKSWSKLKRFYPNIHLAQLHNHLNSHEEEITLAFGNRMNELKTLKNIFDPQGILPPL